MPSAEVTSRSATPRPPYTVHVRQILLAEDNPYMRRLLATALRKDEYAVIEAEDGADCLAHLQSRVFWDEPQRLPDLIISDIRMPGCTGLDLLRIARSKGLPTPVILITAFGSSDTHAEARRLGAAAVLDKPFDVDEFRRVVGEMVPRR